MAKDDPKARILERVEREKVKFMRLQFTDILGVIKNVEVRDRQFEEALDGRSDHIFNHFWPPSVKSGIATPTRLAVGN